jgi:argininosuccinate lyase
VENIIDILKIADRILYKIEFNKEKIKESIDKSFMYAVDIADFLVGKGIPFRDAHKITGNLISYCIEKNKKLDEVTEEDLKNILPDGVNMKEINSLLNPEKSVNLKKTMGSTNLNQINLQIKNAKKYLANEA